MPASSFTLLSREGEQTDYQFANQRIHHLFRRTCGVRSFSHGPSKDGESYSVNVRCLDGVGVDADKLPTEHFDGAKL